MSENSSVPSAVPPLDTPAGWFPSIAQRQAEVAAHGLLNAARLWHKRGECGEAVLSVVEAMEVGK